MVTRLLVVTILAYRFSVDQPNPNNIVSTQFPKVYLIARYIVKILGTRWKELAALK